MRRGVSTMVFLVLYFLWVQMVVLLLFVLDLNSEQQRTIRATYHTVRRILMLLLIFLKLTFLQ